MARSLILNRYRPKGDVGKGSFATVIAAWDTMLQRDVAIKCVALDIDIPKTSNTDITEIAEDISFDENLTPMQIPGLIEARTAAKLNNPNIVSIYDFMVENDTAYVIMEFVEGMSLAKLIEYHNRNDIYFKLTLPMVSKILADVSNALSFAHKHNVLHLDIKPANIMVSPTGVAKVADFGLAILLDAQGGGHCGGGTIGYMPPEQIRNERLTIQTDLWALASVCYEMLTGKNFFRTNSLNKAESLIYNAELELPNYYHPELGEAATDVLFTALSPNAEDRHESILGFFKDFEYFLPDVAEGKRDLSRAIKNKDKTFVPVISPDENKESSIEENKKNVNDEFDIVPKVDDKTKKVDSHKSKFNLKEPEKQNLLLDSNTITKSMLLFFNRKNIKELVYRGVSAVGALVFACIACGNLSFIGGPTDPVFWISILTITIGASVLPFIGIYTGILALGLALLFSTAYIPGFLLIVLSSFFLFFLYIKEPKIATCTAAFPVLGLLNFGAITPLISGNILNFLYSIAASVMTIVLALVLSAAGGTSICTFNILECTSFKGNINSNFFTIITNPGFWVLTACFIGASAGNSFAFQKLIKKNENNIVISKSVLTFIIVCASAALVIIGTVLNFVLTVSFNASTLAFVILATLIYLIVAAVKIFVK